MYSRYFVANYIQRYNFYLCYKSSSGLLFAENVSYLDVNQFIHNFIFIAKMAGMAAGLFSLFALTPDFLTESQINLVAGAGFEPATFGL